jgi:3'(2'), 5'-bisphosphate nucleotidase
MEKELEFAIRIAQEAGEIVMRYYRREVETDWKGFNDPVTAADREANEFLVQEIRAEFPDDGILAEESADDLSRLTKDRVWIVDPLDGTRDFMDGVPQFAVMVGLAVNGRPALGVVNQVAAKRIFHAIVGGEAKMLTPEGARTLHVSHRSDISEMTMAVSRSHRPPLVEVVEEKLGIRREIASGSVGVKVGLLALGEVDIYVHPGRGVKEWDTCAPEAVLIAAGGRMTDCFGRTLAYNQPDVYRRHGIVATNGLVHDRVVEVTREAMTKT